MKTVIKLNDRDYRKIGEHEHWFQEMAEKGLHLKKMGRRLVYFTKGEPKQMRYRVLGLYKEPLTETKKAEYTKRGWDYVTDYEVSKMGYDFSVFSSPDGRGAPEIFENQAGIEKYLNKSGKSGVAAAVLLLIAGCLLEWSLLNRMPIILPYVDWTVKQPLALLPFILLLLFTTISAIVRTMKRKSVFDEDLKIDHNAPWKKKRRTILRSLIIKQVITFFSLLLPFAGFYSDSDTPISDYVLKTPIAADLFHYSYMLKSLPAGEIDLPIVRLAVIEGNPNFEKAQTNIIDGLDQNNNYIYKTNLLASKKLVTYENGYVAEKVWNAGGLPYLETHVYQLKYAWMSKTIANDLAKKYVDKQDIGRVEERSNPEFDELLIYQSGDYTAVFAAKGKAVIYAKYRGGASADTIIKAVTEKISLISS